MTEKKYARRDVLKTGAAVTGATGLAGCGSNDNDSNDSDYEDETDTNTQEPSDPELDSVEVFLSGDTPDTVDFTEQDVLETGYSPALRLTYSNGETEEVELEDGDYEVTDAYTQRTNGEDFYGTVLGNPELPNGFKEEFDEEILRKAGFHQEIDNIDQLTSEELYAGLNKIGFTLDVDQKALQNYTEQQIDTGNIDSTIQAENTVEALKNHEATLEDNLPNEENAVELWRHFRSNMAEGGLSVPASGDGARQAGFEDLYDLEEEVMSYVDNPEDNQEMLRQISQGWIENAGRATGAVPSSVSVFLSDIVARNTDFVPFTTTNTAYNTTAVYLPNEGDIIHMATNPPQGEAFYDIADIRDFEEDSNINASPILNTQSNKESAQEMLANIHELETGVDEKAQVNRDAAVAFMDEIRANNAQGENVEKVKEGIDANISAAVANAMKTDSNLSFEFNQDEEGDYGIEMNNADNNINQR